MDNLLEPIETLCRENEAEKIKIIDYLNRLTQVKIDFENLGASSASKNNYLTDLCKHQQSVNYTLTEIEFALRKFLDQNEVPVLKTSPIKVIPESETMDITTLKANSLKLISKLEAYTATENENKFKKYLISSLKHDIREDTPYVEIVSGNIASTNINVSCEASKSTNASSSSSQTKDYLDAMNIEEIFNNCMGKMDVTSIINLKVQEILSQSFENTYTSEHLNIIVENKIGSLIPSVKSNEILIFEEERTKHNAEDSQSLLNINDAFFLPNPIYELISYDEGGDSRTSVQKPENVENSIETVENNSCFETYVDIIDMPNEEKDMTTCRNIEKNVPNNVDGADSYKIEFSSAETSHPVVIKSENFESNLDSERVDFDKSEESKADSSSLPQKSMDIFGGGFRIHKESFSSGSDFIKVESGNISEKLDDSIGDENEKNLNINQDEGEIVENSFGNRTSEGTHIDEKVEEKVLDRQNTDTKINEIVDAIENLKIRDASSDGASGSAAISDQNGADEPRESPESLEFESCFSDLVSVTDNDLNQKNTILNNDLGDYEETDDSDDHEEETEVISSGFIKARFEDIKIHNSLNDDSSQKDGVSPKQCNVSAAAANVTSFPSQSNAFTLAEKLSSFFDKFEQRDAEERRVPYVAPDLTLQPCRQDLKTDSEKLKQIKREKKTDKSVTWANNVENPNFLELQNKMLPKEGVLCSVSHIESPFEFYIHLNDEQTHLIDGLNCMMTSRFKETLPVYKSKVDAFRNIGKHCVAICYYDGELSAYRVEIIDWMMATENKLLWVRLVDYGSLRKVSYKHLRNLTKQLCLFPKLAVKCYLPLLYPPGSSKHNLLAEWPRSSIEAMMHLGGLIDSEHPTLFNLIYVQQEDDIVAVDMYNDEDSKKISMGQLLMDLGHAVQIVLPEDDPNGLANDLEDIERMEYCNNINEVITGYDPRDEARICKFTRPDGTCFKGANCRLEHQLNYRGGFTTDQTYTYSTTTNQMVLPAVGITVPVRLTNIINACHYHVNLMRNEGQLHRMEELINKKEKIAEFKQYKIPPAFGELILVLHWTKKWLRAKVINHDLDDFGNCKKLQVFMIDYGDVCDVAMKNVRQITEEFLELPGQAIECILNSWKPINTDMFNVVDNFFHSEMVFRQCLAVVECIAGSLLFVTIFQQEKDLGDILQEKGFVKSANFVRPYGNIIPG